jgi:hypothetical protein
MPHAVRALGFVAGAMLTLVPVANADQLAHGPVHAPRVNGNYHVDFTLPGRSWSQVRGLTGGTPALGTFEVRQEDGRYVVLEVRARVETSRPQRRGNMVRLPRNARLRVERRGRTGPVRWWSGTRTDGVPAAVGYQRAPARLDRSGKHWLVYSVLPETENGVGEGSLLVAAVRTAARTMRLAAGPVETPDNPPMIDS